MSKTALVTGASTGIGRAIAIELAKKGFKVLVHYKTNKDKAEITLNEVKKHSYSSELIQFDVLDSKQILNVLRPFDIDVLINNAGIHYDNMSTLMSNEKFEEVVKINLIGPFYISKLCAKKMIPKRSGAIVNIASLSGQTGNFGQANYASSKAGLIALTKTMALELGPMGIRVNAVAPGLIETEMIQSIPHIETLIQRIPLNRAGKPEEVAKVVAFLASDDASYITGSTISINGGLFPN